MLPNNDVSYKFRSIAPNSGAIDTTYKSETKKSNRNKINLAVLTGSVIGTVIPTVILVTSKKGNGGFFKAVLNCNFAKPANILFVAIGSILGGIVGGIIKDKGKNTWNKLKEANFQIISNIAFPLIFLSVFKKGNEYLTKNSSKFTKNIGNFVSVFAGVIIGAFSGSIVANKINNSVIKPDIPYSRKLCLKDFLIHVDDIPVALALSGIPYIDKLLPFILVSRGYEAGKQ